MEIFKKILQKIPSFSSKGRHALTFLNISQSLGAVNDNLFKFVMAFLLIDTLGKQEASSILSAIGAIYVIPFLLFSSSAGILADRFSKQKLLVLMKVAEMLIMVCAIIAFSSKSVGGCYTLLFFLSVHSALFGPSKYGIIRELVPANALSKANGSVTSFTYLAMIVGTFLASFLTEVTHRSFSIIACICLLIAIGGFFSALALPATLPQGSNKKISPLFISEIYRTLKHTRTIRHLFPAILGSSFFLMIGAFTQLNIIPFAMQSLNLQEIAGGYLFLVTALGIALGSYLGGKASKKNIELGLSCLTGIGIALSFLALALFSTSLIKTLFCLFFIGLLGGAFVVPFDTFIQLSSEDEKRGQTIAATNFLSFLGVFFASCFVYFFNEICGLSPAKSFAVIGGMTLVVSLLFCLRLSDLFLSFFSLKIFRHCTRFIPPSTKEIEKKENLVLVLEKASWQQALLLAGLFSNLHFLVPRKSRQRRWFYSFFYSIHQIGEEVEMQLLPQITKPYIDKGLLPCLILDKGLPQKKELFSLFSSFPYVVNVKSVIDPASGKRTFTFKPF